MAENADDAINKALRALELRPRQSAAYKSSYIEDHFEALYHAHTVLNRSYKELAQLLTDNGRATTVSTLKYNMKRISEKKASATIGNDRPNQQPKEGRNPKRTTVDSSSEDLAEAPLLTADLSNDETQTNSKPIVLATRRQKANGAATDENKRAGEVRTFTREH